MTRLYERDEFSVRRFGRPTLLAGAMASLFWLSTARANIISVPNAVILVIADGGRTVPGGPDETCAATVTILPPCSITKPGTVTGTISNTYDPRGGVETSTGMDNYQTGFGKAQAQGSTTGGVDTPAASALSEVTFSFEVTDPSDSGTVLVDFNGMDSTEVNGPNAVSNADFETPAGQIDSCSETGPLETGACAGLTSQNRGSLNFTATVGVNYSIRLIASGDDFGGHGFWNAAVDPEVTIDPSNPNASLDALVFSPNFPGSGPPPVAEPGGLGLLFVGLVVLTYRARRFI
jgi:hypothetical protein